MKHIVLFLLISISIIAANAQPKKGNFSVEAHYGLTGNFFVRSYEEANRLITDTIFLKKNFIGTNLSLNVGYYFNEKWKLSLGYTRQENKKDINFEKAYPNTYVSIESTIRHFNTFWDLELARYYSSKNHRLSITLGASYMRFRQNEIGIYPSGSMYLDERDAKRFNLVDLGMVIGATYDYKIQPKVYLGVATKFHYNATADIAESISLSPYVHFYF
jgi:hypothetical protein